MKYLVTLITSSSLFNGKTRESIEVEADSEEEAKRRGHTLIAMKYGKTYPLANVSVTIELLQ